MFFQRLLNASHIAGKIIAVTVMILLVWWISSTTIEVQASAQEQASQSAAQEAELAAIEQQQALLQEVQDTPAQPADAQTPAPEAGTLALAETDATAPAFEPASETPATTTLPQLQLTASNVEATYDGQSHGSAVAITATPLEGTTIEYSTDNGVTWTTTAPTLTNAGTMTVTVRATNPAYQTAIIDYQLKVDPAPLTLQTNGQTRQYNREPLIKNTDTDYTVSGLMNGETVQVVFPESSSITNASDRGIENVATIDWDNANTTAQESNYSLNNIFGTLKVTPRTITVIIQPAEKDYGDEDPEFTAIVGDGLLEGDTLSYQITRTYGQAGEEVGSYMITVSPMELNQGNYIIDPRPSTLTVNPREITVGVRDCEKNYGTDDPAFEVYWKNCPEDADPDFVSSINATLEEAVKAGTITITREMGENRGEYVLTATGPDTLNNGNLTVTAYEQGELTINCKTVTVTPVAAEKTFGQSDPEFTAIVEGVPADEITYTIKRATNNNNAGVYENELVATGEITQGDYEVIFNTGTLTINPKSVTVRPQNATKVYGEKDPALGAVTTGILGADTLTYELQRTEGENVGEYAITPVGAAKQGNYVVTYESANFTITHKEATVKADNRSKLEGTEDRLSVTIDGLVGHDTLNYTITRAEGEAPGEYPITVTGEAVQGNYKVFYEGATFHIYEKELPYAIVSANYLEKTYGQDDPEFTVTIDGLAEGDTIDYTISRDSGEDVGDYEIHVTGDLKQNGYNVIFNNAGLYIAPAPIQDVVTLDVAASSAVRTYDGQAHAPYAAGVTNKFPENELVTEYSLDGQTWTQNLESLALTHAGSNQVKARVYAKPLDEWGIANYEGELTGTYTNQVIPRQVTLTSADGTKTYDGTPLTANQVYYGGAGFVENEGVNCYVTGTQTQVGTSPNNFSYTWKEGTQAADYSLVTAYGRLTVTEAQAPNQPEDPNTPDTPNTDNPNNPNQPGESEQPTTPGTPDEPIAPTTPNEPVIAVPDDPITDVTAPEGAVEGVEPIDPVAIDDEVNPLASVSNQNVSTNKQNEFGWVPYVVGAGVVVIGGAGVLFVIRRRRNN